VSQFLPVVAERSFNILMDTYADVEAQQRAAQRTRIQRLQHYVVIFLNVVIAATAAVLSLPSPPEPYHTSILTGQGWVLELLSGHRKRIRCELGVHRHVFLQLIDELRQMGYTDSRYVSLEEQLAIFLYMLVTGLTIRHVGERFQRSNDTISK
jgi:hypothetical protein